jgi:5-dehydro-4-deoxyglucarate dehydratase
MALTPQELREKVFGLQAFTCTPFSADNEIDLRKFREHLHYLTSGPWPKPAGCFICCGTGEYWSLDGAEYRALVRAAVEEVGGKVPVVAGAGYGTRMAIEFTRAAEAAGADGVLLFPPYLISSSQEGLYQHYRLIAESTSLGIIVYNRDNAVFQPETISRLAEMPNVIGLKDGYGEMKLLQRFQRIVGDRFIFINGMPSAETHAHVYLKAGIRSYSPGVLDFLPELSWVFDQALETGDEVKAQRLMEGFYGPYAELRGRVPGYGVALVKAGLKLRGMPVGGVRPPFVNPNPEDESELTQLIDRALALARNSPVSSAQLMA